MLWASTPSVAPALHSPLVRVLAENRLCPPQMSARCCCFCPAVLSNHSLPVSHSALMASRHAAAWATWAAAAQCAPPPLPFNVPLLVLSGKQTVPV